MGTVLVDPQGTILHANLVARRLAGGDGAPLDGGSLIAAFPFLQMTEQGLTVRQPSPIRLRVQSLGPGGGECRLVLFEETAATAPVLKQVSDASHAINNSLMGILGQVDLLLSRADLVEVARKKVAQIQAEAERIRQRVAELRSIQSP
jgi:signal transduction histidine kinase